MGVKNLSHAAFFSIALKKMKYKYFFIIPKVSVVGFSNRRKRTALNVNKHFIYVLVLVSLSVRN